MAKEKELDKDIPLEDKNKEPNEKPKVEEDKERMVEVRASILEEMLKRMDRLEYAASKSQLAQYDSRVEGDQSKKANLSMLNGKLVVAWRVIDNLVEKVGTAWVEKQTIELTYLDESKEIVHSKGFWLNSTKVPVDVLSEKKLNDGSVIWEVQTITTGSEKPIKLEIDITFVN